MDANFYVQLKPQYTKYSYQKNKVVGLKATKLTQSRPENPEGYVLKVSLQFADDAFDVPEVVIQMPSADIAAAVSEIKSWLP